MMLQARRQQPIQHNLWKHWHCPMIPSPSGGVDPMEADLHSRGSISAVHGGGGWAATSTGQFFTSIQQDSATRNSQIFTCWWSTC
jgi:hypothetical protein